MNANKSLMKPMVILSAVMIIAFTVAAIALQFATQVELSSTLITCWYGFWTVEIMSLCGLKISKNRHNDNDDEIIETDEVIGGDADE